MSTPIYFPPSPFDFAQAVICARHVEVAYQMYAQWIAQGKPRKEEGFKWTAPTGTGFTYSAPVWSQEHAVLNLFNVSEPFGFIAKDDSNGDAYVVFRGTDSIEDWAADANAEHEPYDLVPGYGSVHHGFLKLYHTLRGDLFQQLEALAKSPPRLYITGHSLGSGLSTVAVPDILRNTAVGAGGQTPIQHYNFASPRTADPVFAAAINQSGVPTYRWVNSEDLVPTLPPSLFGKFNYEHIGTQISFSAQYGSTAGNHSMTDCYAYALAHPDQPSSAS
jgi:predicted lipase